jgi:hypothetical protein
MVVNVTRQSSPWARRSLQEEKKLQLASAPPTYDPNHPDANPGPKVTAPTRLPSTRVKLGDRHPCYDVLCLCPRAGQQRIRHNRPPTARVDTAKAMA